MNTNIALIEETGLQVVEGKVVTTSMAVADRFGKNHFDVLKAIRNLDCSGDFRASNFAVTSEIKHLGATTRKVEYYNITRDGFMFLAMGFTGKAAAEWKEKFIQAFNMMERELLKKDRTEIDFNHTAILALFKSVVKESMKEVLDEAGVLNQAKAEVVPFHSVEQRQTAEEYLDRRGDYDVELCRRLGQRATKVSRQNKVALDKVAGKRRNTVMVYQYPVSILRESFNQLFGV